LHLVYESTAPNSRPEADRQAFAFALAGDGVFDLSEKIGFVKSPVSHDLDRGEPAVPPKRLIKGLDAVDASARCGEGFQER
jgi:hypothetical protein